jgi:tRNA(Ile)-lysidine synthase
MVVAASLSTIVRRALAGEAALAKGSAVLVAVSGGPDSMALLDALARLGPRAELSIVAHGVDHGLREEAPRELDLAQALARRLGVSFERTRVAVAPGGNLQARARVLRWRALVAAARPLKAAIATAHHADDRAETMMMRLLRGAGLRGLGVLPARATAPDAEDVLVVRPLLRARREDVLAHLSRHKVPHAHDPSNDDPRYLRTRIRQRILPLLAELDPAIVRHLEAVADEIGAVGVSRSPPALHANLADGASAPAWASALPRATQAAIAALARSRSQQTRVWLPGGLVVSAGPRAQGEGSRPRQSGAGQTRSHTRLPERKRSG